MPRARNPKGHFLPGNGANDAVEAGEVRIPHPMKPWIDTKGRGLKIPGNHPRAYQAEIEAAQKLKEIFVNAFTEEDILAIAKELQRLSMPGDHPVGVQLAAMQMLMERFWGKPHQAIAVNRTETKNIGFDVTKLSTEKLRQLESIVSDTIIDVEVI